MGIALCVNLSHLHCIVYIEQFFQVRFLLVIDVFLAMPWTAKVDSFSKIYFKLFKYVYTHNQKDLSH